VRACARARVHSCLSAASVVVGCYHDSFLPAHVHNFCSNKVQVLQDVMLCSLVNS